MLSSSRCRTDSPRTFGAIDKGKHNGTMQALRSRREPTSGPLRAQPALREPAGQAAPARPDGRPGKPEPAPNTSYRPRLFRLLGASPEPQPNRLTRTIESWTIKTSRGRSPAGAPSEHALAGALFLPLSGAIPPLCRVPHCMFQSRGSREFRSITCYTTRTGTQAMAKNDAILIDGILDDRVAERLPSDRRDEAFEFFCFQQILRDADLSHDEIMAGSVDGRDDGGVDGFFVLVNGHPLIEPDSFTWPRSGSEIEVWIITCKHHDTFKQAPLDKLVASVTELLDLRHASTDLQGAYSEALLTARAHLALAYRKLSPRLKRLAINFAYASRGDAKKVGESVVSRSEQAVALANHLFGISDTSFSFIGAAELVSIHRRVRTFSLELHFLEALTRGERYILLVRLTDFHDFVVDEKKKIRRYLFDSNVRAFGLPRFSGPVAMREPLSCFSCRCQAA